MDNFIAASGVCNVDLLFSGMQALPDEGTEVYTDNFVMRLGGGAVGSLLALSKLGVPVKILTYIGNDLFSKFAINEITKRGLKPIDLKGSSDFHTIISVALVTERDRTFISYGNKIKKDNIESAEILYNNCTGAHSIIMETGSYFNVYSKLKQEGSKLLLDIGFDANASIEKYLNELRLADVFFPNKKEALIITGQNNIITAGKILNEIVPMVIITADRDGAYLFYNNKVKHFSICVDFGYKDATGAGDAFLAGFAYGLYNDLDIDDCLLSANIMGSKCVSEFGCLTNNVSEFELRTLLNKLKVRNLK
jgi:sugar/nucleoside kinase (ribokinase family)